MCKHFLCCHTLQLFKRFWEVSLQHISRFPHLYGVQVVWTSLWYYLYFIALSFSDGKLTHSTPGSIQSRLLSLTHNAAFLSSLVTFAISVVMLQPCHVDLYCTENQKFQNHNDTSAKPRRCLKSLNNYYAKCASVNKESNVPN